MGRSVRVSRHRGPDERTAYELKKGRSFREELLSWSEKVWSLPRNTRPSRLDSGYKEGRLVGMLQNTNEYWVFALVGGNQIA